MSNELSPITNPPDATAELDVRTGWKMRSGGLTPANIDEWYRGASINKLPSKSMVARDGLELILHGWLPDQPIIGRESRVIGVGSCFASYFILWLAENGFNKRPEESPHNALLRYGASFESPAVIAQQFRWAFEGLDASSFSWVDKDKEIFEASEQRRQLVRNTLEQTDVLILTLGLSEVWYDKASGEPLWRALPRRLYDPDRHIFRIESVAETRRWLDAIESIRARYLPKLKIVFTVSPVRLNATFRPVSAISANNASKAIVRAALDEFLRGHPDVLNSSVFYYPSYEIVQDFFRDPFEEDNRHVTSYVAAQVVRCFADHYCDPSVRPTDAAGRVSASGHHDRFLDFSVDSAARAGGEFGARISELETKVEELQRVCDERIQVIAGLENVANERLRLVERLHTECARLREERPGITESRTEATQPRTETTEPR